MKQLCIVLTMLTTAAFAQQPAPQAAAPGAPPPGMKPMPQPARGPAYDLALEAATTAFNLCRTQGHEITVVVADSAGGIKVALVPDSKPAMLVEFAQRKNATALEFKKNSGEVQALAKTDKSVADKIAAAGDKYFPVPGAILMKAGNEIIGVIAGSGASSDDDAACAQAGLDKVQARLR